MSYPRFAGLACVLSVFCSTATVCCAEDTLAPVQRHRWHYIYLMGGLQLYSGIQTGIEVPDIQKKRPFYGLGYEFHTARPLDLGFDLSVYHPLNWEEGSQSNNLGFYKAEISFGSSWTPVERLSIRPAVAFGLGLSHYIRKSPVVAAVNTIPPMEDGRYVTETVTITPVLLSPKLHLDYRAPETINGYAVMAGLYAGYTFTPFYRNEQGFHLSVSDIGGSPVNGFFAGSRVGISF